MGCPVPPSNLNPTEKQGRPFCLIVTPPQLQTNRDRRRHWQTQTQTHSSGNSARSLGALAFCFWLWLCIILHPHLGPPIIFLVSSLPLPAFQNPSSYLHRSSIFAHHRGQMTTALSPGAEAPTSPPRGQGYTSTLPTRSQSTRTRQPAASSSGGPPPHRAASTSHHHSSSTASRQSSRPVQDVLPHPQHDYETSNVAQYQKRSSSKDRPPPSSRGGESSSRPHRRSSQRSSGHPPTTPTADMPPTAVNNGAPGAPVVPSAADARAKQSRTRTTIPTQSGKWILGKTIGAGSMGKVKLARKEDSNEQVRKPAILQSPSPAPVTRGVSMLMIGHYRSLVKSFPEAR